MGGYGSGRWRGGKPDPKALVESCLALDINALARAGVVRPNVDFRGAWKWWNQTEDDQDPAPEKNKQPRPEAVVLGRPPEGAVFVRLPPLGASSRSGPGFLTVTGMGFSISHSHRHGLLH